MRGFAPILLLVLVLACTPDPELTPGQTTGPQESKVKVPLPNESGLDDENRFETVTVFYRHPLVEALLPRRKRIYRHPDTIMRIKQLLDHLSIAPEDGYGEPIWPANAYVREIYLLKEGLVVIDLDEGFLTEVKVGAAREQLMVYSLVNSVLSSFAEINKVHILIMGQVRETFLGHIDIEYPLEAYTAYSVIPDEPANERLIEEDIEKQPVAQQAKKDREELN